MANFRLSVFAALALAGVTTSCLKEDKCHPAKKAVLVAVQDTDYDNAGDIQQAAALAPGLPFVSYVTTLDVISKSVDNPANNFHQTVVPGSQDRTVKLVFSDHPAGTYEITVSGNAATENLPAQGDYLIDLHPAGVESGDIYLERDTLHLPPKEDHTIYLRRAKGKLHVTYSDFPQQVASVELHASGVQRYVDGNKSYSGLVEAAKSYLLPNSTGNGTMEFLLAPTLAGANPQLEILLYDQQGNPVRAISGIALTIARNHITPLEVKYDPGMDEWEIWIFAEGEWTQLHNLTIE